MMSEPPLPSLHTSTGITDALAGLRDLDELPPAEHVERLRAMHDSLTAALSSIDDV